MGRTRKSKHGKRPDPDTLHVERSVSEHVLHSFDAPDLIEPVETEGERAPRDEPRGGWFKEQRRLGYGITKGKPKPRYRGRGTWPRRRPEDTQGDSP